MQCPHCGTDMARNGISKPRKDGSRSQMWRCKNKNCRKQYTENNRGRGGHRHGKVGGTTNAERCTAYYRRKRLAQGKTYTPRDPMAYKKKGKKPPKKIEAA